jgi:hypothetical protein
MSVGCAVENGSDPRHYLAPTPDELATKLAACTPQAYPDTVMNSTQQKSVNSLMTNVGVQERVFSELYYPHQERKGFETYFGLDFKDARYLFCYKQPGPIGNLYPIEYYDAWYKGIPYKLPTDYVKANTYRDQLRSCVGSVNTKSVAYKHIMHSPFYSVDVGQVCSWQTGVGYMSTLVIAKVSEWLALNQPVFIESEAQGICERISNAAQLESIHSYVTIATISCQQSP